MLFVPYSWRKKTTHEILHSESTIPNMNPHGQKCAKLFDNVIKQNIGRKIERKIARAKER